MRRLSSLAVLLALACCATGSLTSPPRFAVFFQEWSAKLDPEALGALAAAANEANVHPNAPVQVIGFADQTGSPQANVDLSRTRAQVVADQLVTDGVAQVRITRAARGATSNAQTSQESRRVEIAVGP